MTDFDKAQLFSTASSQKVWMEGSGSFTVPALPGAGEVVRGLTLAHNFPTNRLILQVQVTKDTAGTEYTISPWSSNDARVVMWHRVNPTTIQILCLSSDSSGFGAPARTVNYTYRLLIP